MINNLYNIIKIAACFFILFVNETFSQGTIQQILSNGPAGKRINIVILSEGYTASEKSKFLSDAAMSVDNFLNESPFSEYRSYFNAFSIFAASRESGSDHPSKGVFRNTYFNSTYESYSIERLITIPPNDKDPVWANGSGKVFALLQSLIPEYDVVLLIVNDPQYGGSGGTFALTSVHSQSMDVAIHEIGHSFGDLGDEYSTYTPGYTGAESPNTTAETRRDYIKWKDWILSQTPLPTPATAQYSRVVGLFEGASYMSTGWYRPKLNCKMRSLGVSFCEVCMEQLIKSKYNLIEPIESFWPNQSAYSIDNGITLGIVPMKPKNHDLSIRWYINDSLLNNDGSLTLDIGRNHLSVGPIIVKVKLTDPADMVRSDFFGLLTDSNTWKISANQSVQLNAPVLFSPPNNAVKTDPNTPFSWDSVQNSTGYSLQVSTGAGEWSNPLINISGIPTTAYTPDTPLPGGTKYYWRVSASNGLAVSDWSYTWSFTTAILKPNPPILVSPLNNVINQPASLSLAWDSVPEATFYKLQVSTLSSFNTIVFEDTSIISINRKINNLKNNTTYFWRVSAGNIHGLSEWSDIYNFTTINVIPDQPVQVSPENNSIDVSVDPALSWNIVSNTLSYQVMISYQSDFSSILKDTNIAADNSLTLRGLKGKKKYYWKVSAKNSAGSSTWSQVWNFKTINSAPGKANLLKPTANETITLTTPKKAIKFSWSKSIDPDPDDTIKYTISITGPSYNYSKEKISDTSITLDIMTDIKPSSSYSWKITTSDGEKTAVSNSINFLTSQGTSGTGQENEKITIFDLKQNFPNPFNPVTMIGFQIPVACNVTIKIFDIIGKEVATLVNKNMEAGEHNITFEPAGIPGGIYFYKIHAGTFMSMRKMVYLK